jgi:hypothetical protein
MTHPVEPSFYTFDKGSYTTSASTCVLTLVVKEPLAVTVVLHHAKEMLELFYSCGLFNCKYCLHLITLRFNAVSFEYLSQVFYLKCAE